MTISIRREDFSSHFASRSLNVNTMSSGLRAELASHGIDEARLQRAANFDGEIRGEDFDRLFQELQAGDRVTTSQGRATTLDRASSLFTMLDREASPIVVRGAQAQQPGGTGLRGPMGTGRAPQPQTQQPQGAGQTAQAQGTTAPPPPPGPPPDMARLTALRQRADNATVPTSEVSATRQAEIRATLARAEQASQRGDYAAAAAAYRELGLPLSLSPGAQADPRAWETARMIGAVGTDGTYRFGARGNQQLNDLNSFASNAQMMDAMTRANIGQVSNPPTQAQAQAFMRHVGQNSRDPQAVMQAASMVTNGMINHYSSAGAQNPSYGPRMYTFNAGGQHHQFDNLADAQRAARQHGVRTIRYVDPPGDWQNAMSHPDRAGRRVGDCENKEYLQHRLTAAAGFTQLGSVDIQGAGQTGHMLGVMRDPTSGRTFVTSNESFYEVRGTGANGAVTNADIQRTAQQAANDIYGNTRGFTFSYAREPAGSTADPGVAAMRRAQGRVNESILP